MQWHGPRVDLEGKRSLGRVNTIVSWGTIRAGPVLRAQAAALRRLASGALVELRGARCRQ